MAADLTHEERWAYLKNAGFEVNPYISKEDQQEAELRGLIPGSNAWIETKTLRFLPPRLEITAAASEPAKKSGVFDEEEHQIITAFLAKVRSRGVANASLPLTGIEQSQQRAETLKVQRKKFEVAQRKEYKDEKAKKIADKLKAVAAAKAAEEQRAADEKVWLQEEMARLAEEKKAKEVAAKEAIEAAVAMAAARAALLKLKHPRNMASILQQRVEQKAMIEASEPQKLKDIQARARLAYLQLRHRQKNHDTARARIGSKIHERSLQGELYDIIYLPGMTTLQADLAQIHPLPKAAKSTKTSRKRSCRMPSTAYRNTRPQARTPSVQPKAPTTSLSLEPSPVPEGPALSEDLSVPLFSSPAPQPTAEDRILFSRPQPINNTRVAREQTCAQSKQPLKIAQPQVEPVTASTTIRHATMARSIQPAPVGQQRSNSIQNKVILIGPGAIAGTIRRSTRGKTSQAIQTATPQVEQVAAPTIARRQTRAASRTAEAQGNTLNVSAPANRQQTPATTAELHNANATIVVQANPENVPTIATTARKRKAQTAEPEDESQQPPKRTRSNRNASVIAAPNNATTTSAGMAANMSATRKRKTRTAQSEDEPEQALKRKRSTRNASAIPGPSNTTAAPAATMATDKIKSEPKGKGKINTTATKPSGRTANSEDDDSLPFKCPKCDRGFSRNEHMKRHVQSVHIKAKVAQCPGCKRGFTRMDNMVQHQKKCPKFLEMEDEDVEMDEEEE